MAAKKNKTYPTWYLVALARNVGRRTRLRAWKRILAWEFAAGAAILAGVYLLPESVFDSAWEQILGVGAAVLIIAALAYSQRER